MSFQVQFVSGCYHHHVESGVRTALYLDTIALKEKIQLNNEKSNNLWKLKLLYYTN